MKKKLAVMTASAVFALGAAQVANAANTFDPETGVKSNFSNSLQNADKPAKFHTIPGGTDAGNNAGGLGNAFGKRSKIERPGFGNNSIRNNPDYATGGLGNSFGNQP